ncbi:MAG: DUF2497 domain-containing protein [Parvularculaceae bacterium]|nr:MAG: DUF2497 domain-containing protein [Parvularculaceae bacterium]
MASAQAEPSMEEILASIKRIISDEDQVGEPAPEELSPASFGDEAEEADTVRDAFSYDASPAEKRPTPGRPLGRVDIESKVDSQTSQSDVPDTAAGEAQNLSADNEAQPSAFTLSKLAVPSAKEGTPGTNTPGTNTPGTDTPGIAKTLPPQTETSVSRAALNDALGVVTSGVASDSNVQGVLDDIPAAVAEDAFKSLNQSIRISGQSEKTLEDLVTDLLRPLMKEWLDENLPQIVEDKVQDEVTRIARRAR